MKCKCIEEIETQVKENGYQGKKVSEAKLDASLVFGKDGMYATTSTTIRLTLEGKIKPKEVQFMHTYCPFCGVKIKDDEGEESKTETVNQ